MKVFATWGMSCWGGVVVPGRATKGNFLLLFSRTSAVGLHTHGQMAALQVHRPLSSASNGF